MSLRNQNRKTKNKSTDNKELTYYDKLIHKLKNIPLIAIVILIGVVIIGVATFFKNIREFWNISKSKAENVSDSSKSKPREISVSIDSSPETIVVVGDSNKIDNK